MRLVVLLVVLAGCDDLFNLDQVPLPDAHDHGLDSHVADTGACEPAQATFTGAGVVAIAAADFDADGDTDLAIAQSTGSAGNIAVVSAAADRTLAVRTNITPGPQPVAITWYLAAGATYPDLAVLVHPDDQLRLYVNTGGSLGSTLFQAPAANPTTALIEADVLGTSQPELVVGATNQLLFYGVTGNALQNIGSYPLGGSVAFAPGNLGGDSADDLAVASSASNFSAVIGTRSAALSSSTIATTSPTHSIVVADFNGDQKDDIAFAMPADGTIEVALAPTYALLPPLAVPGVAQLLAGEMTGDAHVDLVVGTSTGVTLLAGNGDGSFANPELLATSGSVIALAGGDFDRDGHTDLAYATASAVTVMYACR